MYYLSDKALEMVSNCGIGGGARVVEVVVGFHGAKIPERLQYSVTLTLVMG